MVVLFCDCSGEKVKNENKQGKKNKNWVVHVLHMGVGEDLHTSESLHYVFPK